MNKVARRTLIGFVTWVLATIVLAKDISFATANSVGAKTQQKSTAEVLSLDWPKTWNFTRIPMIRLGGQYYSGQIGKEPVTLFVIRQRPNGLPTKNGIERFWRKSALGGTVLSSMCKKVAPLHYTCTRLSSTNTGFDVELMHWHMDNEILLLKSLAMKSRQAANLLLSDLKVVRR